VPLYRIAVLAGDGIGPEVIAEALKALRGARIETAVDAVTRAGRLTPDLGGPGTTDAVGDAVVAALAAAPDPA
jgi:isocitrate/isopropylmalate dehydrogenase